MKKLLVLVGKSGSGKTTIATELIKRYPETFKKIATCTSRKPRPGEKDGFDYHFLPREYFLNNPNLVLRKNTPSGIYYGTRLTDLHAQTHHFTLTSGITAIPKLKELGFNNLILIRFSISEQHRIERMRQRGDSEDSIAKRIEAERSKSVEPELGDTPVIELGEETSVEENVRIIVRCVNS